jgi:hypothetical protein
VQQLDTADRQAPSVARTMRKQWLPEVGGIFKSRA